MSKPKARRASSGQPGTVETSPLLLHPAAEQALAAVGRVADELAKLNASMDHLIAAKGDGVRPAVEALAEQLIAFLDATADDELEEENEHGDGGADDEPSLGAAETVQQEWAWSFGQNPTRDDREHQDEDGDELDTLEVDEIELRGEADGDTGGCVDDEPSLGSLDGRFSQLRWAGLIGTSSGPAATSNTTRPSTKSALRTCRTTATNSRPAASVMAIIGTLFVCPHCGDCLEQLGEPPNACYPDHFPSCDCGAVMELADDELDRRVAYSRSAGSFEFRGG